MIVDRFNQIFHVLIAALLQVRACNDFETPLSDRYPMNVPATLDTMSIPFILQASRSALIIVIPFIDVAFILTHRSAVVKDFILSFHFPCLNES